MKIVLLDDVVNLGEAGTVAEVKDGYARNFLIPKRMAQMATKDSLNRIGLIKRAADVKRARRMDEAAGKFALLAGKTLVIQMKAGTESRLFGAVTSAMIADEITIQFEVKIERRHIMLDEPIKHLGEFTVPLRASTDVVGEVKLVVEDEFKREVFEKELVEKTLAEDALKAEEEATEAAEAAVSEQAAEAEKDAETHEKYEDAEAGVED